MRNCSRFDLRPADQRLETLFDEIERAAQAATPAELKASIGRAASLGAVLYARFLALAGPARPVTDQPRFLSPKAAAAFLGVSRSTLLRLADAGTLRPRRPTEGTVRFDRVELEAFMAEAKP